MAVWARVVGPLAGREVGDIERFGDHEAEQWLAQGIIVEIDPPRETAVQTPAPERATKRAGRPMGTKDAPIRRAK